MCVCVCVCVCVGGGVFGCGWVGVAVDERVCLCLRSCVHVCECVCVRAGVCITWSLYVPCTLKTHIMYGD